MRVCQTYDVLKTGQPRHWEVSTPEGRIDVYDFPFTDVDGTPMILEMDLDITEAKRAKEGLEKANAYNRSLLEASLDPLVTIRPMARSPTSTAPPRRSPAACAKNSSGPTSPTTSLTRRKRAWVINRCSRKAWCKTTNLR